jgi:F0F1-type ATP synthase delta subunit
MSAANFYTASVYAKAILMLDAPEKEIKNTVSEVIEIANHDISKLEFNFIANLPISKLTKNFLQVLFTQNKQSLIQIIGKVLKQKFLLQQNINLVKVCSFKSLTQNEQEEIKTILQNHFKQDVILEQEIDTKLIGGFTLLINDYLIDFSTLSKIVKIKSCIL